MCRHRVLCIAALLAGIIAAGCGPGARIETPAGFATLDDQKEYVYRSTSADGVAIAIRREKNSPKGNLDFWADIIDRRLRIDRYDPAGKPTEARAASGPSGRQMRYTREDGGRVYRFWVTIFVTDSKVWLVEVGGDQERFKGKIEEAVVRAIGTISIG
jgi:hypothetical protein